MSRRLLAAIAAAVLAVLGAIVLIGYVSSADARARAGEKQVTVYVVAAPIAPGTSGSALGDTVAAQQVPARLVAPGVVTDLGTVKTLVTNTALLPGEQLLTARFSDPAAQLPDGMVAAPAGTVQVSVSLDAQRAVGGALKAGDTVGVELPTRRIDGVLVTRVTAPAQAADPTAAYVVTLALAPDGASAVAETSAQQPVWLSLQTMAPVPAAGSSATALTATLGDDQ